ADEIIKTIEKAKNIASLPFAVFKVSGMGNVNLLEKMSMHQRHLTRQEEMRFDQLKARVERICLKAFENDVPVLIDAEESWIQPAIDKMTEMMMERYNKEKPIVFHTLQMYRHDRFNYLEKLYEKACNNGFFIGVKP